MQAIHFSSMRIEIEKSVSSQPASQSVFYFFMLLDDKIDDCLIFVLILLVGGEIKYIVYILSRFKWKTGT